MRRYSARSASGSDIVTSISVRMTASGVRNSCEAFATNRFCASNDSASRSSIASKVDGELGDLVVDAGVADALGSIVSPDSRRAVAVTCCSGRSARAITT